MRKRFAVRKLFHLMCVSGGILGLSSNAMASAFQLFEQDGASVGNYHAGRSAELNDASAAFYNPAGITRIHNQQIVIGDVGILSELKYRGTTNLYLSLPGNANFGVPAQIAPIGTTLNSVAQGGAFTQVPNLYYVAPIRDYLAVGLSINVPFGLRTDYGRNTAVRYTATKSEIQVVDISPAIGFNVTKQFSLGAGFDIQRMSAQFDQMANIGTGTESYETNKGWSTGYGYHVGALFQYAPTGRVGIAYNSQVVHHIRGTSRFVGPIANAANGVPLTLPSTIYSGNANAHVTLPAYTTISGFQQINDKWAVMGSVMYTQWSVIQNLTLQSLAAVYAVQNPPRFLPTSVPSTNTSVVLKTHFINTWNVSVGANYYANDKIMVRTGLGWDQTPVRNTYREVRIPDANRIAVALGAHYQHNKALGFDLGWTHLFETGRAKVNPPPVQSGSFIAADNGTVQGSADVFGGQFTWTLA
jgi:long-chain fatty acid transport protein